MSVYFITFRSVTLAQRGEVLLKKKGVSCVLQRTPKWMEEQGCGYCLRLRISQIDTVVRLLKSSQVGFRKVYLLKTDGSVEEVTL